MDRLGSWVVGALLAAVIGAADARAAGFGDGFSAYVSGDYATALGAWRPLAEAGDADAQFGLGLMYQAGRGVEFDSDKAVQWFRKAAEQGSERAQTQLGGMYARGDGVEQDWARAIEWWRKAADQGSPRAQYKLGGAYERGDGVARDLDQAAEWYAMAAGQGYERAWVRLDDVKQRRREEQTIATAPVADEPAGTAPGSPPGLAPGSPQEPGVSRTAVLLSLSESLSGADQSVESLASPGAHAVQFRSFRSLRAAEAHWERLMRDYGNLLEGLDRTIKLDQFGTAGNVLYRLRAGPFADAEQAGALCAAFVEHRILCRPMLPK